MSANDYDVIVVGGGVSGITAAYNLKQKGFSFVVLEAAAQYGGTWGQIQFPGIRSDSDMFTYSFNWYKWVRKDKLAEAKDIREYLDEAVAHAGIKDSFRFNTRVREAAFSSTARQWSVTAEDGRVFRGQFLMMTAGYYEYDTVYTPHFDGVEAFRGRVVHPNLWKAPQPSEWEGKNVVVIGSGATAATIVPAMAKSGAKHVTMLQRSPGYWVAEPRKANIFGRLAPLIGDSLAFYVARAVFITLSWIIITLCTLAPGFMRWVIKKRMAPLLPADFAADVHFNPRYNPWDERICLIADGDFFTCLRDGSVSVVTDQVDHFERDGIVLKNGRLDDVDLVCTATGFNLHSSLPFPTNISVTVDGKPYVPRDHFFFNSCMISDVPNLIYTMGYFRYSWTLKADMVAEYAAGLFSHMRAKGYSLVCPRAPADLEEFEEQPDALTCGYMRRSVDRITRSGPALWNIAQNYFVDVWRLRWAAYGKELEFAK